MRWWWGKKKPKSDTLRQKGDHWYEVVDLFDANQIQGIGDRVFIMGKLDDVVVVEMPKHFTPELAQTLGDRLKRVGITSVCFVVPEGVRFLKLSPLSPVEEAKLDIERKQQLETAGLPQGQA